MAEQVLDKKIMDVTHGFNQPSQQKQGIEMGFYWQKHWQQGPMGTEKNEIE